MHLWRINSSAAYTTMGASQANTAADGAYTNAAWVDVDHACGQCHGGSAGPVLTKAELAAGALAMHAGGSATNADCLVCHATGVGGAPVITPGTNHHGLHSTCVGCHPTGHNATLPDQTSNAFCLNCHTNTGAHASPPCSCGADSLWSPVTCQGCHTIPGVTVPPMTTRDQITAGCLSCHISGQGANAAIYPRVGTPDASQTQDNHHRGSSTLHFVTTTNNYGCKGCHGNGASTATATGLTGAAFCGECHTVTQGTDHHVGVCVTCHKTDGSWSGTYGAGVGTGDPELNASCLTCHATPQGTAGAISPDLAAMKHGTGGGTPASFANGMRNVP